MDKRYLLMIVIIFVCFVNLYLIAVNSDVVGSATVEVGQYTCSIPHGFSLYDSDKNHAYLIDTNSKIIIHIYANLSDNSTYDNKVNEIINNSDYKLLSNGTINMGGIDIDSIYYREYDNNQNRSTFYFTKENETFRIIIMDFNYDADLNKTLDYVAVIVDSMKKDYRL